MQTNLEKALKIILEKKYNTRNPVLSLAEIVPSKDLLIFEKNETILNQKEPLDYFYFLLSGRVSVWNEISWNSNNIIEYLEPLEILGLIEYLNHTDYYTAYILAESKCTVFRIQTERFIQMIQQNNELCFQTLFVLGNIAALNMEGAEKQHLFTPGDILGHYLFLQACHRRPYTCPLTRVALAEKLHINLRTLYRHIYALESQNYLSIKKGKIVIEEEQYKLLAEKYDEIIL
ncbi:Crp/Fnr family transcriptional regulator [Mediterraneibacter sp. NSJ-55]|uniref:Crp/Fnr family transcriptional regulator n=1 Tax=Mediterraneibacter hominis TaxID=2763054 RepID=A0A923RSQ0_9FIRM|nr:Crp/Fnr family transcriptional regulator [Mediterraneibacter hominis]MBC5689537.1 Crp/Fnr family transcriptional regulator [Mediterraneibacter hominis]